MIVNHNSNNIFELNFFILIFFYFIKYNKLYRNIKLYFY